MPLNILKAQNFEKMLCRVISRYKSVVETTFSRSRDGAISLNPKNEVPRLKRCVPVVYHADIYRPTFVHIYRYCEIVASGTHNAPAYNIHLFHIFGTFFLQPFNRGAVLHFKTVTFRIKNVSFSTDRQGGAVQREVCDVPQLNNRPGEYVTQYM